MNDQAMVMDVTANQLDQDSPFLVFRLSWLAYARELLMLAVRFLIGSFAGAAVLLVLSLSSGQGGSVLDAAAGSAYGWLPLLGGALGILWSIYSIAFTWSVRVFTNETGVWMFSGVFPWQKGIRGVQWRDVGEAGYTQGFVSWMFRSYAIRVAHRFTQGAELNVRHVHRGNLAVEHINGILMSASGRAPRPH